MYLFFLYSYAREWQAKLRELQESNKLNKSSPRRSPSKDSISSCGGNGTLLPLPPGLNNHVGPTPSVSITPSKRSSPPGFSVKSVKSLKTELSPIKMDSNGALNLVSSPSPPNLMTDLTSTTADSPTSRRSPTLPQNVSRPQVNYGVEMCVVCGDRASGKFVFYFDLCM